MKNTLAIIICNYNKKDYLKECLQTIENANNECFDLEIIVVDNNSSDGSRKMLIQSFPKVTLIENPENSGGAGGFAMGMQYAVENHFDYVSLLDNDTKVDPEAFVELFMYLKRNPDTGVVGSTILQMDKPKQIQEMGARLDPDTFFLNLLYRDYKINDIDLPEEIECDYVPACCFMTRGEVLKQTGIFDKKYFIYFDDIDWCTRVRRNGYKINAIKSSKVWHKGGGREAKNTIAPYYFTRNYLQFFSTYLQPNQSSNFTTTFCKGISQTLYFANKKGMHNHIKALLIAIDDAYANRLGPQWHAVLEKTPITNPLYDLSQNKDNILIKDCFTYAHLKQIIINLQYGTEKQITLLMKHAMLPTNYSRLIEDNKHLPGFSNKNPAVFLEQYISKTTSNVVISKESINDEDFDLVIQATDHISEYSIYEKSTYYIDAFGNWIMNESDKLKTNEFDQYQKFFNQYLQPEIKHKIKTLFNELNLVQ